jgi:hypothetical protein
MMKMMVMMVTVLIVDLDDVDYAPDDKCIVNNINMLMIILM